MADQIRTFIAVELDEANRRALAELQANLKQQVTGRQVRWGAPDGIHLTLKFLGSIESEMIPALERAVAEACRDITPFVLTIGGVGAFPNLRRPNVVWVGLGGDVQAAARLAENIERNCEALGFARENRPFAAHLTLGRVKRETSPADRQFVGNVIAQVQVGDLGIVRVDSISIMKSDLRPTGSIYTGLSVIKLAGKFRGTDALS